MLSKLRQGQFLKRAALLALLSILFQTVVPFIHQAPAYAAVTKTALHICSSHVAGDSGKSQTGKLPSCPVCQTLQLLHSGFVAPPDVFLALVTQSGEAIRAAIAIDNPVGRLISTAQPRAPPFFA